MPVTFLNDKTKATPKTEATPKAEAKAMTFEEIKAKAESMRSKYASDLKKAETALKEAEEKRTAAEKQMDGFSGTPEEYAELYNKLAAFKEYEKLIRTQYSKLANPSAERDEEYKAFEIETNKAVKANTQNHVKWMRGICEDILKQMKPDIDEETEILNLSRELGNSINVSPSAYILQEFDTIRNAFRTISESAENLLKYTEK